MQDFVVKRFDRPDEVWPLPGGAQIELVKLAKLDLARGTAPPGWCWSKDIGPLAETELCETAHVGIVLSGAEAIRMADGTEFELHAGDVFVIGAGHDAWVVGDEPCVSLDFLHLAQARSPREGVGRRSFSAECMIFGSRHTRSRIFACR